MILSRPCTYVFLPMTKIEMKGRSSWYQAAMDSVRGIFPEFPSHDVAEKTTTCTSSDFGISFFSSEKAGDYAPRFCDSVLLGKCINSSRGGPYIIQCPVHVHYSEFFEPF